MLQINLSKDPWTEIGNVLTCTQKIGRRGIKVYDLLTSKSFDLFTLFFFFFIFSLGNIGFESYFCFHLEYL